MSKTMTPNGEVTGIEYGQLMEAVEMLVPQVEQDFILLTGLYRCEYHHQRKMLVIEERSFDRIDLKERRPELYDHRTEEGNLTD